MYILLKIRTDSRNRKIKHRRPAPTKIEFAKKTGFGRFNKHQNNLFRMTETRKQRKKMKIKPPQLVKNAVRSPFQFWKVLQCASPQVNHIEAKEIS